ncbi:MAG: hypothetical protein ACOC56_00260 [Atribacterota bacterium]
MKLYAQHGHAPSRKMHTAVENNIIEGVILSPRYLTPENSKNLVNELKDINNDVDILLDPEFYSTIYVGTPNAQLRYLEEWPHFVPQRRNELLVGSKGVDDTIKKAYKIQIEIGCTQIIAPNIYITNSFDSIEAAIAISFINRAKPIANEMNIEKPVYTTLSVSKNAIVDQQNYINYLNAITAIDLSPDGVYILIGAGRTDERGGTVRSEILTKDVISGWMLLNYSLSLNGLEVVNGFSDILTPFLCASGGYAGTTGWWSNLQVFSMGRYIKSSGGGQLPLIRYLSKKLLNRITINEREAFVEFIPSIMNGLPTDISYEGRQPDRIEEALQTWQSISSLNDDVVSEDINESLSRLRNFTDEAENSCIQLKNLGFSENFESNMDYLLALKESLTYFEQLAEL